MSAPLTHWLLSAALCLSLPRCTDLQVKVQGQNKTMRAVGISPRCHITGCPLSWITHVHSHALQADRVTFLSFSCRIFFILLSQDVKDFSHCFSLHPAVTVSYHSALALLTSRGFRAEKSHFIKPDSENNPNP